MSLRYGTALKDRSFDIAMARQPHVSEVKWKLSEGAIRAMDKIKRLHLGSSVKQSTVFCEYALLVSAANNSAKLGA